MPHGRQHGVSGGLCLRRRGCADAKPLPDGPQGTGGGLDAPAGVRTPFPLSAPLAVGLAAATAGPAVPRHAAAAASPAADAVVGRPAGGEHFGRLSVDRLPGHGPHRLSSRRAAAAAAAHPPVQSILRQQCFFWSVCSPVGKLRIFVDLEDFQS